MFHSKHSVFVKVAIVLMVGGTIGACGWGMSQIAPTVVNDFFSRVDEIKVSLS